MGDLIVKSNSVVKASYRLNPLEQSILLYALTKIDHDQKEITDQEIYDIDVPSVVELSGINSTSASKYIQNACDALLDRKITISNGIRQKFPWIQLSQYDKRTGVISIRFSKEVLPYLTNLKVKFTSYNMKNVAKFRSTYGVRIYELIKQWSPSKNFIEITPEEIRELFQLGSAYNQIGNIKRKIIEPAIKDINEYSDLIVDYDQRKTGRKVTHLIFKFKPKDQKPRLTKEYIEQNARAGESWEQAKERLKKEIKKT